MPLPGGVQAVLTDVEGTTTPLRFVTGTLFPFALERLAEFVAAGGERAEEALDQIRQEYGREPPSANPPAFGCGAPYAAWLMACDRKSTGLKMLQGLIWEQGYRRGELRGEVFPDVPAALIGWTAASIRLRVFSSGSVLAQRLLFAHTPYGDLSTFFEGYHDTTTGPKQAPGSYTLIARAIGLPPPAVLFLSDTVPELDAARDAQMRTGLLLRPGNCPTESGGHPVYSDFTSLIGCTCVR